MNRKYILSITKETIEQLERRAIEFPTDPSYLQILGQIKFIHECLIHDSDIGKEKGDRVLNFPIIASKNLTDESDYELTKNLDEILNYVSNI